MYAGAIPGMLRLIYTDEAPSSEHASSVTESGALVTASLPANKYTYIKVEAIVQNRDERDLQSKSDFTWKIKYAGSPVKTFTNRVRIICDPTTGTDSGGKVMSPLWCIFAGGQASADNITITVINSVSHASVGSLVVGFAVYGII